MRYKNTVALVKGHYQGLPGDGTENSAAAGYFYQLVAVTSKTMDICDSRVAFATENTVVLVKGHYQKLPGDGTENSQLVAVTSKTMVPIKKCICQICTFIVGKHYFSFDRIRESQHSFTSLH